LGFGLVEVPPSPILVWGWPRGRALVGAARAGHARARN
jgi:hypothetical protein